MSRNVFVNIFRNYLVSIHRFFYLYIKWEKDATTQTIVVFAITILCWIGFFDSYLMRPFITNKYDYILIAVVLFFLLLPIYFWYLKNKPFESELKSGKDFWSGIILFILSIISLSFFSKFYFF